MSERFDDLARRLATPMPRRRTLAILGGAVLTAAIPGLARRGGAQTCPSCGQFVSCLHQPPFPPDQCCCGTNQVCHQPYGICCQTGYTPCPDLVNLEGRCCPPGIACGTNALGSFCCQNPGWQPCGPQPLRCCPPGTCNPETRECEFCGPDDPPCGTIDCCKSDETCCGGGFLSDRCCPPERPTCCADAGTDSRCCSPDEICCDFSESGCCPKTSTCCGAPSDNLSVVPVCCPEGKSCCTGDKGNDCCSRDPGWKCCDGLCCPPTSSCCLTELGTLSCTGFDDKNCGECGVVCPPGTRCEFGQCKPITRGPRKAYGPAVTKN